MALLEFRSPKPRNVNDYRYWLSRDRAGNVEAFRHLLNGDEIDHAQEPELLSRDDLPLDDLRQDYDILVSGGIPAL